MTDYREEYLAGLKTWEETRLGYTSEQVVKDRVVQLTALSGMLLNLRDALKRLGYKNLGDLLYGAETAKLLSPADKNLGREITSLQATIRELNVQLTQRENELHSEKEAAHLLREQVGHRDERITDLERNETWRIGVNTTLANANTNLWKNNARLDRAYVDTCQNLRLMTEERDAYAKQVEGKDLYISQLKEKLEHNRDVRDSLNKDNERLRRELREKEQAAKPAMVRISLRTYNRPDRIHELAWFRKTGELLSAALNSADASRVYSELAGGKTVEIEVPADQVNKFLAHFTYSHKV